jgi:hypothetical protein
MKISTVISPPTGAPRHFVVREDQYGVHVVDTLSGASVILDWNGRELKAVISSSKDDEALVFTLVNVFGESLKVVQ